MNQEESLLDAKEFFEHNKKSIGKRLRLGDKAIIIDFNSLAEHSLDLANSLIERPEETVQLLEVALEELEWAPNDARVRLSSISETQEIKIRNIRSKDLGKMIAVDGIIRRASEIRPLVTNMRFECPSCGTIISVLQLDKEIKMPSRCSCGRKSGFKEIAKDMVDSQIMIIEESSDDLDDGCSQPKRLTIHMKEDLTDKKFSNKIIPGNKIKVIGVLSEVLIKKGANPLTRHDIAIEANNIIPLNEDVDEDFELTEDEEEEILEISKRDDLADYLAKSVAPTVYGNIDIKKALALQIFGGVSKQRTDGSKCREQIHGLLVGDPGVAKSVILKYLQEITRKSRYISGKGASGVGMTATVVKDEISGGFGLEAGAMVLANKGSLFIDEFEKMSDEDRSNLHEGMSIGTITVAKANIQATLNAKTSILAAANPKYGRFDINKPLASQINLMPSLLSRFDFIFVMRDEPGKERDSLIADKIFSEHTEDSSKEEILEKDMFKKYVSYAKQFKPKLNQSAIKKLKEYYVGIRDRTKVIDGKQAIPLGARQLEGLIRFSEAAAKMRLSKTVTIQDAEYAINVMESYLMEIGYDKENNTFDIDKIAGNGAKQRGKVDIIKNTIRMISKETGGMCEVNKLKTSLDTQYSEDEIDDTIEKFIKGGELFRPKKGFIRLM